MEDRLSLSAKQTGTSRKLALTVGRLDIRQWQCMHHARPDVGPWYGYSLEHQMLRRRRTAKDWHADRSVKTIQEESLYGPASVFYDHRPKFKEDYYRQRSTSCKLRATMIDQRSSKCNDVSTIASCLYAVIEDLSIYIGNLSHSHRYRTNRLGQLPRERSNHRMLESCVSLISSVPLLQIHGAVIAKC